MKWVTIKWSLFTKFSLIPSGRSNGYQLFIRTIRAIWHSIGKLVWIVPENICREFLTVNSPSNNNDVTKLSAHVIYVKLLNMTLNFAVHRIYLLSCSKLCQDNCKDEIIYLKWNRKWKYLKISARLSRSFALAQMNF